MHLHVLLETSTISISYDEQNQWLYADWHGEHNQASARAQCQLIAQFLQQYPCTKLLNDNSNVTRAQMELTSWGLSWLDEVYRLGVRYIAWVFAPEFLGRRPAEAIVPYLEKPRVATFDDLAAAYGWLRRQSLQLS